MARLTHVKKPKNTKQTLKRFSVYLGYYKISIIVVAILVIISALSNLYGIYLLKPIINDYIAPRDYQGLMRMLLRMALVYGAGASATFGYTQIVVSLAQKITKEFRRSLFEKVQSLPLKFFDASTHGEIMSRFTNDIDTVAEALNNSFASIIQSTVIVVGSITMIISLSASLSVIVIIAFIIMIIFMVHMGKKSKRYFSQQQKYLGELNGFIEEMVEGQKVVKIFNYEEQNLKTFNLKNEKLQEVATQGYSYSGAVMPTVVSMSFLNYAMSACIGGLFAISGLLDAGTLVSYLIYVRQTAMPMNQFSQQLNFILNGLSGAERVFELMDYAPEADDGKVTLVRAKKDKEGVWKEDKESIRSWAWKRILENGKEELIPLRGDVRFQDVYFGYQENREILKKINLYAKPGQKIAFVGSTGAGKTTITNLINRFYEINAGTITYDGIDIKDIKKDDLRRSLTMVLQDTHLFTGTIAENISYGRLEASKEDIIAAAKLANADSFIRRLPKGYDTMLYGDGANLSQGQRQLLAIARAAISTPPVLILDEATSSIDTYTERLIEKGMDSLMENRTVFVIAHRLSTVRNAEVIVVLSQGEIIEKGSHDELIAKKERYYQLYTGKKKLS
jgi:ABC-type multidrug transport system, ATPase and permease components